MYNFNEQKIYNHFKTILLDMGPCAQNLGQERPSITKCSKCYLFFLPL